MVLGYYKFIIKQILQQSYILFRHRINGVHIGKGCKIHKTVKLNYSVFIKDYCSLSDGVELKSGVSIGNNVSLSRIIISKNTTIEGGVKCTGYGEGKIIIGKESYIGVNNILDWSDNITIGNYVHIAGPSTGLWTHSSAMQCHSGLPLKYKDKDFRPTAPIVIEDFVYIGGNCTIYPGITIGHHSIIAPNSAVDKNVEPYSMVGGVPARFIKMLVN